MLTRRAALAGAAGAASPPRRARAQAANTLRIGVLNDQSGVYRDVGGPLSVICARQAIAEFASQHGLAVELRVADHLNKTDIGASVARQWFDDGVDVIMDIQGSGIALPFPSTDFSAAIVQATASGAKVVALANAGLDLVNCVKQAVEFGLTRKARLATLLMFQNDVHAIGLENAQGSVVATTYYWDLNDHTRAFAGRVAAATGGTPPNMCQAANYSALLHYMKCAAALGPEAVKKSGRAAADWMKRHPVQDDVLGAATIRPDGIVASAAYLFEVKAPAESRRPWDYFKLIAEVPPEQAWIPLDRSACKLLKS